MAEKKVNIDNLIDSYLELASSNPAILEDILVTEGYNVEAIEKRAILKIRQLFFKQQVAFKKASLTNLYDTAITIMQAASETSKEAIFNLLRIKSPSLQFRNLEKLDEENLRQILNETEILNLIEKLERGELK